MKRGAYIFIILFVFFLLFIAAVASFFYMQFGKPPTVKTHSYLEIVLNGEVREKPSPDIISTLFQFAPPLSLHDIWMNFKKAEHDPKIDKIVLRLGYLVCDWGKANEIRELILDFRKSGKSVYAYFEEVMEFDKEYYLATACDKIIMHPEGILIINGIGGQIPFLKNALDRLGVEAEVEHMEEYKTAYHMFTEDRMTPAQREMIESLYQSLFDRYITTAAEARKLEPSAFKSIIDQGFFQGPEAKEFGLVDELLYEDEFIDMLLDGNNRMHRIDHDRYTKVKVTAAGLTRGRKIALIYGMGPIISGEGFSQFMGSATISRWIRRARKDDSIAAIVFRVDSPGGSVVASDTIWREVTLAKKEKPFIVSMSDMAGSGGYQVSMAAHKIVAHPQTLTGSIGVIFAKFNFRNLYDKLGVTTDTVRFGEKADMFSSFRKLTPKEKELMQRQIRYSYDRFVTKVALGRSKTKEEIYPLAKGRVWTGEQALELGLVDEMGGLSRALEIAKEMAGIPQDAAIKLEVWPKKISFFEMMFGRKTLNIDLPLSEKAKKVLSVFQLLRNESPWALMPFWIETN